jgi:hypothetical protein
VRWRRSGDPTRELIRGYGPLLSEVYRKLERRIRWPLDPEAEWWTLIALRCAATGAAVGLGESQRWLFRSARHPHMELAELITDGPRIELIAAFEDRSAVRSAYRVLLWAYAAETTAELWAPTYGAEMDAAARVLEPESDVETEVIRRGAALAREVTGGAASQSSARLLEFRLSTLAALVRAAIDRGLSPDDTWVEDSRSTWLDCYARGKTAAASQLKRLVPSGLPSVQATVDRESSRS